MLIVVESEGPEPFHRRQLSFGEGDRIEVASLELLALAIVVPVALFGFFGEVVIHIRLGSGCAVEVVGAPLRVVYRRIPAVAGRTPDVAPLEERQNQFTLGGDGSFLKGLLYRRVLFGGVQHAADPPVESLFARQRRHSL